MKVLRLEELNKITYINLEHVLRVSVTDRCLEFNLGGDEYIRVPLGNYAGAGLDAFGKALRPLYESRAGTVHGILLELDLRQLQKAAEEQEKA